MPKKRIIIKEDYPMVLDWSNYKSTNGSKLPCKCQGCGVIVFKRIVDIDRQKSCFCRKCGMNIKSKQTNLKKYGVTHPTKTEKIQKKISENSSVKREIVKEDYPMVLDWSNYKTTTTKLPCECQGCGITIFKTIHKIDQQKSCFCRKCGFNIKGKKTNLEKYCGETPFHSSEIKEKIKKTVSNKYGVPYSCMIDHCRSASKIISKPNLKLFNTIKNKLGIECKKEFFIQNQSFDLKIDNLLIEINPTFSHNSTYSFSYSTGRDINNIPIKSDYHFNKWKLAKDNGYILISIFDNMDENKILSVIRSKLGLNEVKIGARKCQIKEISQKECNIFLEQYHVQGKTSGQKICIGLFYDDDLLGVMTFGTPRFNKNYEFELVRLCFKENVTIQGGVSKMWNYFKETYNPTNCICYLNLNLGGDTMNGTDFTFKQYNKPAGYWENLKTGRTITNNSLRMRGASRFIGDDDFVKYPKGTGNREIMMLEGFVEMYDCGNVVYEYKK